MASLLHNGRQRFINPATGFPLVGGKVYFYLPGTLKLATTYRDKSLNIKNSNPVILDSAGSAVIWGSGSFRQIVTDAGGNQIWDQATSETSSQASISSGSYIGNMTGGSSSQTTNVFWQKTGNLITINLPSMLALVSNSNTFTITGGPTDIATSGNWTTGNVILSPCFNGKNTNAITNLQAFVDSLGTIVFLSSTTQTTVNPNPQGWSTGNNLKTYGKGQQTSATQYPSGITFSYLKY